MTTRLQALTQTVCIVLILMLFPGTARLQEREELVVPQPDKTADAGPIAGPEEFAPYIVKQGDTLWDITDTFLKDPFLWPFIWKANPYITNPDLIFPGSKLTIPSLAPIERALKAEAAPKESLGEKHAAVEKPIQPTPVATDEELPAEGSGLVMPEERIFPIIDKYAMLSAGFVNGEETGDTVVGSPEKGKAIFGYDDIVYVSIRGRENINLGDKYLIFTPLHKVKHPKTGATFGKLIKGLGILQITAKDPAANVLTARITLSFDAIEKGNMLTPYQEPALVYQSPQKKAKDISGYILEVTDKRSINAQADVVYLDKGNADGVEPGDRFLVYVEPDKRGFPREMIGEVQVLLVKEHTSTAFVRKSTKPMGKGSAVDFKK